MQHPWMMKLKLEKIMNYLSHRITNAMSEGINSKIARI
ncbi:transposase [Cuniculiplasma sp. SKW3]